MKAGHERRIEIVTGIDPGRRSNVLFYGANVGEQGAPFDFNEAAAAMFPDRYPAEASPIALGLTDSSLQDKSPEFWGSEARHLATRFDQRVRERVSQREIDHLSVFALAPQPLLVLLGTLLGDIAPVDVYQRHREPTTWSWPTSAAPLPFEVREPESFDGPPALVLALSATVTPDRIQAVLGADARIWSVTVAQPGNDVIKAREHLARFRTVLRGLFDRIKAVHGHTTTLHVFPVVSVSAAVEFGRSRMPKADMTWCIYDQNNEPGGFVPTINIPLGGDL
nr:SAVED domain-containing protein [Paludisphaera mucosa]